MKRIGILLVLLVFGFAFVASAQQKDLGELAKKEKERREALEKSGKKVKVLTNEDVDKLKSQLAIESGTSEGEEGQATEEDSASTYTPPEEGQEYIPAPQPEPAPPDQNAEQKKRLDELENEKSEAQKTAEEARATVGAGGLYHSRNTGDQYKKAGEAEKKIEEIDKQIDKTNSQQQQQQAQQPPPPPQEEYVPPPEETTEEPPAEEPPSY